MLDLYLICTEGEQVLRAPTTKVEKFDEQLAKTVEEMFETMKSGKGIGLAAPQVGISKRFFVVQVEGGEPLVFINPDIIETSVETCLYEEGCLSVPGFYKDIERPARVKVQAWNQKGRRFVLEADGILARVIQHENDHLNGIIFTDKLPLVARERLLKLFRKKLKM